MNPLWLTLPLAFSIQVPPAPMPEVEARDLLSAPRGPMVPRVRDGGAERSLLGQTRHMARRGNAIPALQLPTGNVRVKDKISDFSGWRAYAIEVPGGGSVKVQVVDGRKGWYMVGDEFTLEVTRG